MDPRFAAVAVLVLTTMCSAARQHHQFTGPSGLGFPTGLDECDPDMVGFELVTGVVYTAPTDLLDSLTGVLMLTDCLEACQGNDSCEAVNFETGLCVLFSSSADSNPGSLTRSQYPVFTIYAQKSCLGVKPCERAWCFDRVTSYKLEGYAKKRHTASSRQDCLELCLGEREFPCRSANYNNATRECTLSDMDRTTVAGSGSFRKAEQSDWDYLENNCVDEPAKLCEFRKLRGRILKTVDSVYQDVGSADDCRELCLNSPFRCRSYDYGDTGETVCRISHHSRATLVDVAEPYLNVPEAATYELSSCYNVTVDCRAGDMVARVKTSRLFTGKIYAKGAPNSCVQDVVDGSMEFELQMGYDDLECNVRQQGLGRYLNDVVIQHHDTIVTSSDLGLAVTCQYDLTNKSVSNEVDLGVRGDVRPALTEEVIVDSPSVAMKITDRTGSSDLLSSAEVGDPLALRFEILDRNSPYEIFVRELVAMDGVDSSEIVLIDSDGCPTDQFIMGPVYRSGDSAKVLLSHFDAFKFPSSEMVQFRALVTPCMPTCEPVQCDQEDTSGELRSVQSLGRRRRRRRHTAATAASQNSAREDLLLVQSIHITDKFGFNQQRKNTSQNGNSVIYDDVVDSSAGGSCMNLTSIIVPGIVLLLAQLAVIACWTFTWQRQRRKMSHIQNHHLTLSLPNVVRTDSLCKLYESGYARRF